VARNDFSAPGELEMRRWLPWLICPAADSRRPPGKRLPGAGWANSPSQQQVASRL